MSIAIKIKHAGKAYDIDLDPSAPGSTLKQQIFELTGVDPSKVKVVVKGGMLKDDADMSKLGLKPGQTLMVIGAAGELPKPPPKIIFMEDMTDTQLAEAVAFPVGLENLGNTCYMNSTVQVLRSIPELQTALNGYTDSLASSQQDAALTAALRDLYKDMGKTSEGIPPVTFLRMLRVFAPQFAERSRTSGQYSQQDAQEAWTSIVNAMKGNLEVGDAAGDEASSRSSKFVQQFMSGEMTKTLKCTEAPEEATTSSTEPFLEIKCNISSSTNYMMTGISEAMDQDIEKNSPSLGRSAVYRETSRISRLPAYLTVNLVRFFWRRDINKKTKIMRKVKFPFDLDVIDLLTDDLKAKVLPANEKLKAIDKDRQERAKVRRRAKVAKEEAVAEERGKANDKKAGINRDPALSAANMAATAAAAAASAASTSDAMVIDSAPVVAAPVEDKKVVADGELVDEPSKRIEESQLLRSVLDKQLSADVGANMTGLYELAAIVTHKGASADGGHYVGWSRVTNKTTVGDVEDPNKQDWYRFDDEKVSIVEKSKILTLDGGGEDHTAYILLYASKKID